MSDRKDHIKVLKQFLKDYQEWGECLELEESVRFAINYLEVDEKPNDYDACIPLDVQQAYENGVAKGFNDAMRKISLSGIHEEQYKRGRDSMIDELKEIRQEIGNYKLSPQELEDMDEDSVKWGLSIAFDSLDKKISELEKTE